jgi:Domain of unknown function (DUF4333)
MKACLLAAATIAIVALSGCGDHARLVDTRSLQTEITLSLAKDAPAVRVTCPERVPIHSGGHFDCSMRGMGDIHVVEIMMLDASGRTHWWVITHG